MCPTLCDPIDCSPPGSSIHGTLHERVLEWLAIPFHRRSSWLRDWTQVSLHCRQILHHLSHQGSLSNSISHSNKLWSPLILHYAWKFLSSSHADHDSLVAPMGTLEVTPSFSDSFPISPLQTDEVLWRQLRNSGQDYSLECSKGPTAHCASSCHPSGWGLSFPPFLFLP